MQVHGRECPNLHAEKHRPAAPAEAAPKAKPEAKPKKKVAVPARPVAQQVVHAHESSESEFDSDVASRRPSVEASTVGEQPLPPQVHESVDDEDVDTVQQGSLAERIPEAIRSGGSGRLSDEFQPATPHPTDHDAEARHAVVTAIEQDHPEEMADLSRATQQSR